MGSKVAALSLKFQPPSLISRSLALITSRTSDFIRKSPYPGATNSSQGAGSASSTLPAYHTGLQLAIQNAMSPESALGTAADDHVVCIRLHTYKREIIICPAYASDEKEGGASGQKEGETKPTDVQGQLQGPASTAGQNAQQQARIKDDVRYTLIVVQQTPYGQKVAAEEKAAAARAAAASGTSAAAGDGDEGK